MNNKKTWNGEECAEFSYSSMEFVLQALKAIQVLNTAELATLHKATENTRHESCKYPFNSEPVSMLTTATDVQVLPTNTDSQIFLC